jgi:hypothetical protein
MRAKTIKRKKRITSHYPGSDTFPYYAHDGVYSKNKIHCSCRLCRGKDYNGRHILTEQELASILKLKEELDTYNEIFGTSYELVLENK